ncbi:hypothetical protein L1887_23126 [Cichorium endivia]|nr:hypothetical protein L1887_23126 [Cichorium endivia]
MHVLLTPMMTSHRFQGNWWLVARISSAPPPITSASTTLSSYLIAASATSSRFAFKLVILHPLPVTGREDGGNCREKIMLRCCSSSGPAVELLRSFIKKRGRRHLVELLQLVETDAGGRRRRREVGFQQCALRVSAKGEKGKI